MSDLINRSDAIEAVRCVVRIDSKLDAMMMQSVIAQITKNITALPSVKKEERTKERTETHACDCISRQAAIDACKSIKRSAIIEDGEPLVRKSAVKYVLEKLPSAEPQIIHCKDCKHWKQQTNYAGAPLSFGFCESDEMWRSLYGETYEVSHIDTDDDFYCGYAERRTDE